MSDAWKIDGRIWTPEAVREMEARLAALEAERDRLRLALRIIAGDEQGLDNLMGNADVARAALEGGGDGS